MKRFNCDKSRSGQKTLARNAKGFFQGNTSLRIEPSVSTCRERRGATVISSDRQFYGGSNGATVERRRLRQVEIWPAKVVAGNAKGILAKGSPSERIGPQISTCREWRRAAAIPFCRVNYGGSNGAVVGKLRLRQVEIWGTKASKSNQGAVRLSHPDLDSAQYLLIETNTVGISVKLSTLADGFRNRTVRKPTNLFFVLTTKATHARHTQPPMMTTCRG